MQVNTLWDRLLSLFMFVAATLLLAAPCNHCHKSQTCRYLPHLTSLHFPKDMVNPLLCSCNVKCDNVLPQGEVEPRPAHFELQPQSDSQHIHPCWCPPATVFHIIRQTFQWVLIVCQVNSYEQLWWVKFSWLWHPSYTWIGYHRYLHGLVVQTLARLHLQGGHEIPGYQLDASSESNICLKLDRPQVVASVNLITSVISRIAP